MTINELIGRLEAIEEKADRRNLDGEYTHKCCDETILQYINDPRVTALHEKLCPWYA